MKWKPEIHETNDDADLDILFYQLFSEQATPLVNVLAPRELLNKLLPTVKEK